MLELHHLKYWAGRPDKPFSIFGRETADDLEALCRDCHLHRHAGPDKSFYADPEECAAEWDYFRHVMDKDD
jgi:hypothetical protein